MQYIAVILGIFGLDFGIKDYIEKNKSENAEEKKLGGFLLIRKHHNRGAFLNAGQERRRIVAALSVVITLLLTVLFVGSFTMTGMGLLKWGLSLMLGGAYSNTYDRLKRKYVVDYVSFHVPWKGLQRIIFNISDFCIMIGALLSMAGYFSENNT